MDSRGCIRLWKLECYRTSGFKKNTQSCDFKIRYKLKDVHACEGP